MVDEIGDLAAKLFATKFYVAIASGQSLASALKQAQVAVEVATGEGSTPEILARQGIDPSTVLLVMPPTGTRPSSANRTANSTLSNTKRYQLQPEFSGDRWELQIQIAWCTGTARSKTGRLRLAQAVLVESTCWTITGFTLPHGVSAEWYTCTVGPETRKASRPPAPKDRTGFVGLSRHVGPLQPGIRQRYSRGGVDLDLNPKRGAEQVAGLGRRAAAAASAEASRVLRQERSE